MYGIPEDFDPAIFVGAMVERVCFGPYIVHVDFGVEEGLRLSIEGTFEHSGTADGGWQDAGQPPIDSSRLVRLAGQTVKTAVVKDAQTLALSFDDDQALHVYDSSRQYESFQIHHGQDVWVV